MASTSFSNPYVAKKEKEAAAPAPEAAPKPAAQPSFNIGGVASGLNTPSTTAAPTGTIGQWANIPPVHVNLDGFGGNFNPPAAAPVGTGGGSGKSAATPGGTGGGSVHGGTGYVNLQRYLGLNQGQGQEMANKTYGSMMAAQNDADMGAEQRMAYGRGDGQAALSNYDKAIESAKQLQGTGGPVENAGGALDKAIMRTGTTDAMMQDAKTSQQVSETNSDRLRKYLGL